MHYQLDIESLLSTFSMQPIDWMLESQGPTYHIRIILSRGKVTSCLYQQETDKVFLEGEAALLAISRLGRISWTVTRLPAGQNVSSVAEEALPSATPHTNSQLPISRPPPALYNPYVAIPTKTNALIDATRFPRIIQHIFFLIDGQKNVQHIAQLVGRSPEEVWSILQRMRERGMITF
jgi:hypothetical protein